MLAFIMLILNVSLTAYGTEEEQLKSATEFSSELELFLADNSQYSSSEVSPESGDSTENVDVNTNRLIVSTYSNDTIENTCGALDCIEGYNNWHILQYDSIEATASAYNYYSNQDYVNYVEYDEIIDWELPEPDYSSDSSSISWGADKVESVKAVTVLNKSKAAQADVVVAVIDTGVDSNHDFFKDSAGNSRILPGNREKDNSPDPSTTKYDHGTHVAGIIVDNTPSNVKIKSYNYFYYEEVTTSTLVTEISSAISDKVDVINLSLSGVGPAAKSLIEEIEKAVNAGIVVVAAAGNDKKDANGYYPANIPEIITVAAVNSSNKPSTYNDGKGTNYGNVVDISAPGSSIYSTIPNNKFANKSGTSMATPFVSAAAAILKSTSKSLSSVRICEILKMSAYKPSGWANNYASNYGSGIVNFKNMLEYVNMPAPTITLGSNDKISITSLVGNNATYYYTTNGTTPTTSSTRYTGSFSVPSGAKSIKAIAVVDGIIKSSVAEYPIQYHTQITVGYKCKQKLDLPDNAKNINYSVSDKSIVSVEDGQARGLKPGETIITVTMNANRIYYFHVSVEFTWWQFFHQIIFVLFGVLI